MKKILLCVTLLGVSLIGGEIAVLSSDSGRYVYGQLSSVRADQFLLDTKTGRLWNMKVSEKGDALLQPVMIENVNWKDGKYSPLFTDSPIDK